MAQQSPQAEVIMGIKVRDYKEDAAAWQGFCDAASSLVSCKHKMLNERCIVLGVMMHGIWSVVHVVPCVVQVVGLECIVHKSRCMVRGAWCDAG